VQLVAVLSTNWRPIEPLITRAGRVLKAERLRPIYEIARGRKKRGGGRGSGGRGAEGIADVRSPLAIRYGSLPNGPFI